MRSASPYERFGRQTPYTDTLLREHVFAAGETVTGLAHTYYGDWRQWRLIAERNDVADPRRIEPGTKLLIPDLPLERGRFERV